MIPRRAFYTWSGTPESMPWLRQLTVETFKKFNPGIPVVHVEVEATGGQESAAIRSDLLRYKELYQNGGIYFDTDIVWFAPLPDAIFAAPLSITLDASVLVSSPDHCPHPDNPGFSNIGLMAAEAGHPFFRDVMAEAQVEKDKGVTTYQGLGVQLLKRMFWGLHEAEIRERYGELWNLPLDTILPLPWWHVFKLYNGTPFDPPPGCCGVHWFGGAQESRRYCQRVTLESYQAHPCYLSKAIDKAME